MGLNLNSFFTLLKKSLIVANIISLSFMLSIFVNGYIALKSLHIPENISIKKEHINKKTQSYNYIKAIFLKTDSLNVKAEIKQKNNKIYTLRDIKLIGTLIFNKERIALIDYNGKTLLVKKGKILNGYKIKKINKNSVYLIKNGEIYKIIRSISEGNFKSLNVPKYETYTEKKVIKLSRGLVEKETADIGNLLKDVRLIPIVKNGETLGFKFTYINPRSLLYKYGFRSGDLIKSVNGMPVRTAEEAFKIYNMLRNENRIEIEINRNGKRKVIIYEIQ